MATKKVPQNRKVSTVLTAKVHNVTPALAEKWLGLNLNNRSPRPSLVDKYARDMENGAWMMTGEPVKFDTDGRLIDGQHRLFAIVQSKCTVPLLVLTNVAPEAQLVMDTGAGRTASDALAFSGHHYTALTAAAARLAINYDAGNMADARGSALRAVSHSEIVAYVEANPLLVEMSHQTSKSWRRIPCPGSVIVFTSYQCWQIDPEATLAFFDDLADYRADGPGDPRYALLRRFQTAIETRERMSQTQRADAIFRAWNAHRLGRRLTKIAPHKAGGNFTDPR